MSQPFIVVVTGRPGSGKTTLAHKLSQEIHCPALCRDEFKEGYVHTMGGDHASLGPDVNRTLYELFFESVQFVVKKNISVVIEAAFQHKLWEPKLNALAVYARIIIVVCSVDPHTARLRCIERGLADHTRELFHGDKAVRAAKEGLDLPLADYSPPALAFPTLEVDTTSGYQPTIGEVVDFIAAHKRSS
jgi:predicted kinase